MIIRMTTRTHRQIRKYGQKNTAALHRNISLCILHVHVNIGRLLRLNRVSWSRVTNLPGRRFDSGRVGSLGRKLLARVVVRRFDPIATPVQAV